MDGSYKESLLVWSMILSILMYAGPALISVLFVLGEWRKKPARPVTILPYRPKATPPEVAPGRPRRAA